MNTSFLDAIPVGRENAVSAASLARLWNCDQRVARRIVAQLRAANDDSGLVILSSAGTRGGYWRSNDEKEIHRFVRAMSSHARSTFLALRSAKRVLKKIEHAGQTSIEEIDG